MNALVWSVEWQRSAADRRGMAFRVVGALGIAAVIATGALPDGAASAAFAALFVGYGLLRSATSIFRDEQSGLAGRVLGGGVGPSSYLLQRAAASASLSLVGLLPALGVVGLSVRPSVVPILVALGVIAVSLWVACVLGVVIGAVSTTATEVLVLSGVTLVLLLHVSGVFHTPEPEGIGALLEGASPFGALHQAFAMTESGGPIAGLRATVVWAVLLPVAVAFSAPRLTASPTH